MSSGSWSVTLDTYHHASKVWSGGSTPRGVPKRELGYTMSHSYRNDGPIQYSYDAGETWSSTEGITIFATEAQLSSQAFIDDANARCIAKLRTTVRSGFNAGIFAAELPKAIESVVGSCKSILAAYFAVKRGDMASAIRTLARATAGTGASRFVAKARLNSAVKKRRKTRKNGRIKFAEAAKLDSNDISSLWLSLQYAWRPLMSDLYELCIELERYTNERKLVYRAQASSNEDLPTRKTYTWSYPNWWLLSYVYPEERKTLYRRKRVLSENPSTSWRLGLTNPSEVVWELVPFSFVVDWFIPIGDFLANRSLLDLKVASYTDSLLRTTRYVNIPTFVVDNTHMYKGMTSSSYRVEYTRWANNEYWQTATYLPPLKMYSKAFSSGHLKNGAALIHQQIGNRR